jgi:hypothetical protein
MSYDPLASAKIASAIVAHSLEVTTAKNITLTRDVAGDLQQGFNSAAQSAEERGEALRQIQFYLSPKGAAQPTYLSARPNELSQAVAVLASKARELEAENDGLKAELAASKAKP